MRSAKKGCPYNIMVAIKVDIAEWQCDYDVREIKPLANRDTCH